MVYCENYNKSKFRACGTTTYKDEWGTVHEKTKFCMTRAYKKYLEEKAQKEKAFELQVLKNKLEYQKKTYGEVDEYDYNEYIRLVQQSYSD